MTVSRGRLGCRGFLPTDLGNQDAQVDHQRRCLDSLPFEPLVQDRDGPKVNVFESVGYRRESSEVLRMDLLAIAALPNVEFTGRSWYGRKFRLSLLLEAQPADRCLSRPSGSSAGVRTSPGL